MMHPQANAPDNLSEIPITVVEPPERRDGDRIQARLMVRGLGADRAWRDQLGNLAFGGVGFVAPRAPEAERFRVAFHVPGEKAVRNVSAELIDFDPLPGSRDREDPVYVRLRFSNLRPEDRAALDRLRMS